MPSEDPRGGTYRMNHESFGRMMVSGQLRKPLVTVSKLIAADAKANTIASSTGGSSEPSRDSQHLANNYKVENGGIVVVKGQNGIPGPRISQRVVNRVRYAAAREFGRGRPRQDLSGAGLRGSALKAAKAADVLGPNSGTMGTRDLRRAGEKYNDGIDGAA